MDHFTPEQFNALFGEALQQGGEAMTKVAQATGLYVQHKLREMYYAWRLLAQRVMTLQATR